MEPFNWGSKERATAPAVCSFHWTYASHDRTGRRQRLKRRGQQNLTTVFQMVYLHRAVIKFTSRAFEYNQPTLKVCAVRAQHSRAGREEPRVHAQKSWLFAAVATDNTLMTHKYLCCHLRNNRTDAVFVSSVNNMGHVYVHLRDDTNTTTENRKCETLSF